MLCMAVPIFTIHDTEKIKGVQVFFKWSTLFWHKIEDRLIVARARKIERFLSQAFFVAEVFTGTPEKYVGLY